jgi:hypothetical protein
MEAARPQGVLGHYVGGASGAHLGKAVPGWSTALFAAVTADDLHALERLLEGKPGA